MDSSTTPSLLEVVLAGGASERPALWPAHRETPLSFADIQARASAWSDLLTKGGLSASHRIAVQLANSADTALALLSLVDRVSLMPMNPAATSEQTRAQLAAAGADALLAPKDVLQGLGDDQLCHLPYEGGSPATLDLGPLPPPKASRGPGLVLHTSGSTGAPKRVPLEPARLITSARNIAAHLALGPDDRAIHALPMFHIGALVDLLAAPLSAGGQVILARDLSAEAIAEAIRRGGTWLQLVPTALAHLVTTLPKGDLKALGRDLRFIRMVSADLPEDLRREAEQSLGVPVIQMYGMTETAGQIASNPLPPGTRKPHSVGHAAGAEVAIIDAHGSFVDTGREGEVCVRGPSVMTGYEGDAQTPRHGDWLRSGDLGRLDDDGYLFLTGRAKEIINRGGEKISPVIVERAALSIDGVREAVAFSMPHPSLGEQVGLAVVADEGMDEATIMAGLAPQLAEFERPRRVSILGGLARLPSGKIDRRLVAQVVGSNMASDEPQSALEATVSRLWSETLSCRAPHAEADFFDDGGDSLAATDFLAALDKALGRSVTPNLLFEAPRFGQLIERLEADGPLAAPSETPLIDHLRRATAGWAGQRIGPRGLIVARNTVAKGMTLVLGSHDELPQNAMAPTIARDNPIMILRTSFGFRGEAYRKSYPALAELYAEELSAVLEPGSEIILGGFCGGANMAEVLAPQLTKRGYRIHFFLAIDKLFKAPTPYPVFHIWTDRTQFSLVPRFDDPTRGFADWHPTGADMIHASGQHAWVLSEALFRGFEDRLLPYMAGAPLPRPPAHPNLTLADRQARYAARVRVQGPLALARGAEAAFRFRVQNTSNHAWPAFDESGLSLVGLVQAKPHRYGQGWKENRTKLDRPLAPGEVWTGTLPVKVPRNIRPGLWRVMVTMMDDGYGPFRPHGKGEVYRPLWIRP